ncbi:MAG: hypothetical protein PVJ05_05755 [Candidatus Thorarchaeota archaeon]|jgi:hypothetical protein
MILPIIIGFVVGRFVIRRNPAHILGLILGVVMGIIGGLEVAPAVFPFMVVQIPWIGIPEIRRVGLVLGHPHVVLFAESINFQSFSLIILLILVAISIIGTIAGVYLGARYRGTEVGTPWEGKDAAQ